MKNQLIELAVRSRKTNVDIKEFLQMKDIAVKSLVRIKGVGPEHEFDPIKNYPEQKEKIYIGTTRYKSIWSFVRTSFNLRFMRNLIKFLKMCYVVSGVFLKPEDKDFDYINFANKENITEIVLLKPKGISKEQFLKNRIEYLKLLDAEDEVIKTYLFKTKFGFKNTDVIAHFTVYKNRTAFDALSKRINSTNYHKDFMAKAKTVIISSCNMIK